LQARLSPSRHHPMMSFLFLGEFGYNETWQEQQLQAPGTTWSVYYGKSFVERYAWFASYNLKLSDKPSRQGDKNNDYHPDPGSEQSQSGYLE